VQLSKRARGRALNGILLLDKPAGISSNDALQRAKRMYRARKAGHTGSLDRLASGLLPLCFGEATKLSGFLLNADKRYHACLKLGVTTRTGDAEGDPTNVVAVPEFTDADVEQAVAQFRGEIEQIPPMHSALKVDGQRLYKLAHQGIEIERKPRQITIHELEIVSQAGDELRIDVLCSKGTYIRTLAEDIGKALGCGAHVTELRRVAAGPFTQDEMVTFEMLDAADAAGQPLESFLLPIDEAVRLWPVVSLTSDASFYIRQGQAVLVPRAPTSGWVKIEGPGAQFLGVGEVLDDGRIAPRRLIRAATS
jgi:tRNA pseudouridine55 synthase